MSAAIGRDRPATSGERRTTTSGRSRPLSRTEPTSLASRRERRLAERAERAGRPRARATTSRRPAWQSPIVLFSALALVVGVGLVVAANLTAPQAPDPADTTLVRPAITLPVDLADGEAIGEAGAPVLLEVWSDYQCPVCGTFATTYLPRLVTDFVATGQLRIVDRSIDILGTGNPNESLDAAVGAVCAARQGQYWAYHDYLFWNQSGENRGAFSRERLGAIATAVGLDRTAWDTCFGSGAAADEVIARTATALGQGINSTPTFVVNGQATVGLPRSYDELAALIRAALPADQTLAPAS
jgi:protein-disulfide isomerase